MTMQKAFKLLLARFEESVMELATSKLAIRNLADLTTRTASNMAEEIRELKKQHQDDILRIENLDAKLENPGLWSTCQQVSPLPPQPRSEPFFAMTAKQRDTVWSACKTLCRENRRINAIKLYKDMWESSLSEAKHMIDNIPR